MDKLNEVARILDDCLTQPELDGLVAAVIIDSIPNGEGVKRQLFVNLLEHAGETVMEKLNRELSSEEVILIFNRIRQFLTVHELY